MRPWLLLLLLLPLLASHRSLLGDGDRVMENYSWSLDTKLLLLNGRMSPRGAEILQIRAGHDCMSARGRCVCVAVQHKHRTSPPFQWTYTVHDDHGCSLSHEEFTGIIHWNHIPALVVFLLHEDRKSVATPLEKLDSPSELHVISEITTSKAAGHVGISVIKDRRDSVSAWLLHHHTAASGRSFKAFSLEKHKIWAPASIVQLQRALTKKRRAAKAAVVSSGFEKSGVISALKIKKTSKQQMAQPQRATQMKVLMKSNGQQPPKASARRQDVFPAALPSSSSLKTSDKSQLDARRKAGRIMKNNGESSLHERVQMQRSLKAASRKHDDGSGVKMQRLFRSRETTENRKRQRFETSAAQDDDKKEISRKIITKQADPRSPEGQSETEQTHTNAIKNGNQESSSHLQEADRADNNDVDHNQKLNEVGEEVLILLFLPDAEMEIKVEALLEPKLVGWRTIKTPIKLLDDPSPVTKVVKENFIIELCTSKCNCLKESQKSSEIHAPFKTKAAGIKPAERAAEVTTKSAETEKQVTETAERMEETGTDGTRHENVSMNHFKQEENVTSEQPVLPSPPSVRTAETEPAKTTAVNMEIKEMTSSSGTQRADEPLSTETPTTTTRPQPETRFMSKTNNSIRTPAGKPFSGLRMRGDIAADASEHHEGSELEGTAATNRPETERGDENDPNVNWFIVAKPPTTTTTNQKQTADQLPETSDDNVPLCGGLIHRTEAGWKHCVERFAGTGSKMFSSGESTDTFQDKEEQGRTSPPPAKHKENLPDDDGYDHFYYIDGVMRRVQNNFYPYYKRQRRRKRSHENTGDGVFTGTNTGSSPENLLGYIRLVAERKKSRSLPMIRR